mmetsp:Transcript_51968/g.59333  ORF Transcript_51968/g.59333 Transcript_51968/m.59333 type:complete len:235 (-) Transcript_51968:752-1456(-)
MRLPSVEFERTNVLENLRGFVHSLIFPFHELPLDKHDFFADSNIEYHDNDHNDETTKSGNPQKVAKEHKTDQHIQRNNNSGRKTRSRLQNILHIHLSQINHLSNRILPTGRHRQSQRFLINNTSKRRSDSSLKVLQSKSPASDQQQLQTFNASNTNHQSNTNTQHTIILIKVVDKHNLQQWHCKLNSKNHNMTQHANSDQDRMGVQYGGHYWSPSGVGLVGLVVLGFHVCDKGV